MSGNSLWWVYYITAVMDSWLLSSVIEHPIISQQKLPFFLKQFSVYKKPTFCERTLSNVDLVLAVFPGYLRVEHNVQFDNTNRWPT